MKKKLKIISFNRSKALFLLILFAGFIPRVNAQNCTVNAGVPQTICENEVLRLYGKASGAFGSEGALTVWTQVSGPSVYIVSPNSLETDVLGISAGLYTFRLTSTCADGSLVYQDVTNTVLPISDSYAGEDFTGCPGTYSLSASILEAGETGSWAILSPNNGISLTDASSPESEITVSGNASGATRLVWTTTNANGCSSTDTVVVTNRGGMPVSAGPRREIDHCYSATQSTSLRGSYGGSGIDGQMGTWTIVSGPNVPSVSDIHNNNSGVSNLVEGTYVFQWKVVGSCASGTAYDTIVVPAPTSDVTNAGATGRTNVYCDGRTSIVLNGTYPGFTSETVLWEQVSGPAVTIHNPGNHITDVEGLDGSSSYSFRYTISNNLTNCHSSAVVNVHFADGPSVDIIPTRVDLSCGESVANIPYTSTGDGAEAWSIVSGPISSAYPSIPTGYNQFNTNSGVISIPGLTVSGTYVVRVRKAATAGSQCETVFDDVTIVVSTESALANAGTGQFLACDVDTAFLAGNNPSAGQGTWSQVSGPNVAVVESTHNPATKISGLINGVYIFRWLISGGPFCFSNQDDVEVIVADKEPTQADAGTDLEVCVSTPVFLSGNAPILNEWGEWSVVPENPAVVFNDPTAPSTYVEGLAANTTYQLVWSIYNMCGESHDTLLVSTNTTQGPILADAGADICLASGTGTFLLEGNEPSLLGEWTQVNGTGAIITDPTSESTSVTVSADGTYYFEWAISANGCEPTRDTVRVTIAPEVTEAIAGGNQEICGNSAVMNANTPLVGSGSWIQIGGAGGVLIEDHLSPASSISGLTEGVYKFVWEISNEACEESRDTVTLYVSEPAIPAIAGEDQNLCGVSSVTMAANNVKKGLWSVISAPNTPSISNISSPDATIGNLIMGTYVLSWTSYGGVFCPSSADTVVIDVVPAANAGADQEYCELTTAVDLTGNINSIGTWTQVGNTPNVATVTATSGNTATASGLVPGIYTFQYEISDGTCTSTDVVTVTLFPPPPIANAGNDADYCDASSFVLTGNNPQASNGEWTLLYGPSGGNFVYSNDSVVEFTATESNKYGVYIFTWKLSNGDCRNEDQVRITNYEPAAGNAGADISVACKSSVFLDALLEIGNGLWSFVSVSGDAPVPTIVSPILPNTEITGLGSQSSGDPAVYQFQYTISNGPDCDTVRDTVFVTVYEAPTEAFAGNDVTLCSQSTYNLEATPTTVGSGKWIHVNGPNIPVIADSSAYNSPVSGLIAGTYVFYWETTTEFCSSVDSFVLVNYDEPSAPDDLADFEICQFEELILSNSIPVSGTGKWSQTSGPAANILSPASASTQVVGIIPGSTYTFRWIVSNGVCTPLYDDVTVTVHEQVTMAEAGANQAFCNQTSAVLNGNNPLIGTGTWTVEDGPNVPTFTNANLPNTPVTGLVAGTYTLRWTIDNGTCSSYDEMLITVYPDLTVSSLTDGNVCVGGAFNLSVSANGGTGAYTYQWQDSIAGGNWQNVTAGSGATAAAYTTPSSLSSGTHYYRVLVSDCNTVISNEAELVVNPDASIAVQPLGASICPGSTHAMNVTVMDGVNVSYQWQRSTTGTGGWSNITGATTPSFTTPALNSTMFYRVRINDNGIGCADPTSNVAAVYVPYIRTQPAGAVICDGGTHTMSLAMESNGGLAYSYQWQQSSTSGGAWSDISGATSASYTTTNLTTGNYYYQCVITPTTPGCSPLTSSEVQVAVVPDPQITAESGDVSICEGGAVTHSVSVSGGTASSYSYQWQRSSVDCSSGFSNIAGATSANYTTPQLSTAGSYYYRCVITQPESGCQFISSCKTITVVEDPQVDTQPVGTTICSGSTHSMNVVASGGTGIFSYQWQDSIPGGNWTDIFGAVADAYTTAALTTKTYFRVIISQNGVGCDELYSEVAEVAVPEISSQPTGGFVCEETPNTLSISVDAGSATLHYQWQSSDFDCNSGWFDIAGANNASYSADNLPESGTRYFRCVVSVTAPDCTPLISDCVALVKTGCTPLIGVAKQLVNTIYNEDGTADVLFNIRVQNYGNVVLDNIQVEEDLTTAFNNNFEILELASTSFDVNTSFNGNSDKNLLNNSGTTNMLGMGASTDIRLKVRVLATGSYTNQVTASSPSSGGVSDTSQNGSDPDPDGDGDPTNNSEGTPVEIGSCTLTANVTQHSTCGNAAGSVTLTGSEAGTITLNGVKQVSPATFPGLQAGWYNASFKAVSGCIATVSFEITNSNSDLAVSVTHHKDVSCNGGNDGEIEVSATDGSGTYSYYLVDGGNIVSTIANTTGSFSTSNLVMGEYSVRVEDSNGCTYTVSFDIEEPTRLVAEISNYEDVSCNGATDGTATVNATGGTTPYSYLWSNGQTTAMATGLVAGNYTVTVTDANNCTTTTSVAIGQPATALVVSTDQVENPTCNGETDGSISITVSGGTAPYSYSWSNGYNSEDPAGLAAGTYTVIVTDANGCTATESYTLTEPAALSLGYSNIVNTSCNAAVGAVTLTGSEAGTVVLNGVSLASPATFTGLAAGYYTAYFENAVGCSTEVSFNIINTNSDLVATLDIADPLCVGETVTATVTANGGTAPYSYTLNGTTTNATGVFDNLGAGDYNVLVTDNNGCTYYIAFDIDEPTQLVAEIISSIDVSCNGATDGAATVNAAGGTTPYSYLWSNGQTTAMATGMGAGTYSVTVTDANNCTTTASVAIGQPASALFVSTDQVENPTCNGETDGSISITVSGGTAPYSYSWSNGYNSEDPAGLAAGTYTVIVTDANGCTATESYTLTEPAALSLGYSNIVNTSCNAAVGAVTLTGSEAGTVVLNGVSLASPATFTGLAAGYYTAYFENAVGCSTEVSFNIINTNSDLVATLDIADPLCVGETVTATVTANGGTAPYSYTLNGTTTNATGVFDNLGAGDYNVLVTDNNGCTYYIAFDIDEPTQLVAEIISSIDVSCNGATDGAATVNAAGGTTPYSYLWSNGQTTAMATGMGAGTYLVTVTDANGCSTVASVTITENTCAPLAVDDNVISPEDTPASGNVLDNDSDANGLPLTVTEFVVGGTTYTAGNTANIPGVGTLVIRTDGTYTFTPEQNYNGSVPAATYTVSNGTEGDTADLSIFITPVNDVPVAVADAYSTSEDTPVSGNLASNDIRSGDGGNTWMVDTNPGNGSVTINPDGTFTYTPDTDFSGTDSFTYKLCDVDGDCVSETVEITVSPVNDNPVAVDDYIATNEDTPVNIPLVDNDNFGGDGPSTSVITIVSPPSNGQAVVNNNGTPNDPTDDFVEYTPNPDFNGSDNFVYEICDANEDCDQGNVIVNVNPVGDSPLAVEDAETMDEDGILYGNVSTNDTRSGDGGNIWTVVTNPSHGTVIMNPDGSYIYTPEENYNGPDSFTYQLCDVDGSCSSATVEIEVGPLNDPPVIADVPKTGPEDEDITFDISDFTSAFSDVDGDELTKIEIVTLPENGTLYLDGVPVNPGDNIDAADISLLTFTPDEDWNGTTTFDWNGYDANSKALIDEQVIITITPVNDPPVAGIAEIPGQQNPGGTNTVKLPASGFSGTDKDGDIDFILLTEIPAGATSITVDGTIYTTIPAERIKIPATDGGQPLFDVEIDPDDGVSEVVLEYFVIDNEGLISESPGSVTIPFTGLSVSGTVFNDTNGLADHTVNGTGSNFGGALYMNLVNDLNQVIASIPVGADGTYSFTESDGLEQGKNYKLIISGSQQNTGATLSSASYPEGYTSSGENIGSGIGNDGKTDGVLSINTNAGSLSEANFGILGEMTVDAGSDAEMCSTEGSILLSGAQAVNYTSLRWTSDGTGTFDDATAPNPEYFPSVADISDGQVRLTLIVNGLGSVAQMVDAMKLTIWPGAKVYAGPDFEVCANLPVIITGATAADYGTITWSSTGGTFDNIHALNPTFTPLASGNIELVLTASGLGSCSNVSDTVVIAVSEAMVLSAPEITNANCDSREDGGVRLGVGSGGVEPFIYELSTGESNSTGQFEGLAAGGYIYWVTDANGCKVSGSFKVDDPNELELTVTAENDVTCYGGSNGSASLEASGGTGPYTFGWSGGIIPADPTANPQVVSGLPAGFYVVTVTDANGCVEIESLEIEEPDSLSIILVDQINPDCNNAGQVMVSGSGGVPPYSYSATSGTVSGNTISGLSSGDVTVTITDSNGCTNFLTVTLTDNDESAPVVSCPAPIQTTNTIGLCFAEIELELPVYTDNCDTEPTVRYMVYGPDNSIKGPFSAANNTFEFSSGISQVQWMVTDASGNETSCMQEVTVRESEDPEISCTGQDEYVFYSTPGLCGYRIPDTSLDVSAMDNCQLLSVSHNFGGWGVANSLEGAVFPVGSTEVIWTATDYAGNSVSCNFTVTVIDTEEPSFVNCPDGATFTVGLFAGACQGGAIWSIPVASDACSDVTVSQTSGPEVGSILEAGTYVIEYEATDDAGNSITCSFNLVVTDTEGPVIVCLPDIEKTSDSGTCTWKSPEGSLSPLLANSNCPATVNWRVSNPDGTTATGIDDVSGYTFQPGTSTVYYAISENTSGQDWDCSFSVTIVDREKPVIDCPEAMTVTALPGECEAEVALTVPAFSDNCSSSPADISYVVYAPDNSMSEVMNSADLSYTFMAGINRIEWRVTDAAGNSAVCWQSVWVNTDRNSLVPEAGGNAAICENDSFQVVNALAPDFATIEWTTSGTGHFVDNTLENPVYVPSETDILDGFVILTITASSSCESASDNLVLSIAKAPVVFAGSDASICENDTYQLNGSIQNRTLAVEWETLGTGTFSNAAIFNPVYTPGAEDAAAGKVTLVFRGISAGTCENGVDSLTLNIQRQAEVFAGEDAWICEGSSFELSGATLKNGGPVIWSTNGTGTFDAKNVLNTVYTPSRGDILNGRVVLTVAYESEGACSSVSDEMILNISRHPEVDAGSDVSTCFGLPVTLSMASAVNAETIQWFANGNGMLEGANSLTPRYIPAEGESGEIILTLVATGNGACETDTVTDEVILIIYNELVIDAGADDTIFYRSSAILDVDVENGSGAYFYTWKPAETVLNDKAAYTETVKLTETTKFSVTVTDASSGCVAEVSKTVVVDSDSENLITIFNAFTPNGDGVNDTWQIEGIEKFPENEVMFFNRWGDKVKEFQNYDNVSVVWDGTNNRDKKLPDGTYYYIVTLKNVETYTGWVHIRSGN